MNNKLAQFDNANPTREATFMQAKMARDKQPGLLKHAYT